MSPADDYCRKVRLLLKVLLSGSKANVWLCVFYRKELAPQQSFTERRLYVLTVDGSFRMTRRLLLLRLGQYKHSDDLYWKTICLAEDYTFDVAMAIIELRNELQRLLAIITVTRFLP